MREPEKCYNYVNAEKRTTSIYTVKEY
jgi:hypothetical protein